MPPHVKRMKEKYADKHPHHWTSKDVVTDEQGKENEDV